MKFNFCKCEGSTHNEHGGVHYISYYMVWYRQPAICSMNERRGAICKYEERICEVEHASFVPLVLSCTGGAGPCAINFFQRLAALQAEKHHSTYSMVMEVLRCHFSSAITCLRSARSSFHHPGHIDMSTVYLAMSKGRVECD